MAVWAEDRSMVQALAAGSPSKALRSPAVATRKAVAASGRVSPEYRLVCGSDTRILIGHSPASWGSQPSGGMGTSLRLRTDVLGWPGMVSGLALRRTWPNPRWRSWTVARL